MAGGTFSDSRHETPPKLFRLYSAHSTFSLFQLTTSWLAVVLPDRSRKTSTTAAKKRPKTAQKALFRHFSLYVPLVICNSTICLAYLMLLSDLEFSRLESWSRDVSRPVFTSLGLGLGLGALESRSRSWSWNLRVLVLVLVLEPSSLGLGLGLGSCHQVVRLPPLLLWNGYLATVVC